MAPELSPAIYFSDSVIREEGTGKLSLIGGFQFFNAGGFPFQGPPFVVTVALRNLVENQQIKLGVRIVGPDESTLADTTGQMILKKVESSEILFEFPIPVPQLNYSRPGTYLAVISLNDQELGRRPLLVRAVTSTN
ncbi:MAG: hypothetical protein WB696_07105 [Chthoniobacterales bacterium]